MACLYSTRISAEHAPTLTYDLEMSDDVLVKVDNVSKRFCRSLKRSLWYGIQDLGSELGGRHHGGGSGLPQSSADVQLRADEFWAVKDVSFELRRGECLGLIGRNGAGKTTLLKMLNGLIKPDTGRMEMRGQTGALIALGAGFNPVLTGRENILINASVMGLSKIQAKDKIDEIIDFAEIRDFIDSPVQNYSSGMQVRLGFAVATAITPDILILDEVLAVGDARFRARCYERIDSLLKYTAVIFVSHQADHIARLCSKAIFMKPGTQPIPDSVERVLEAYEESEARADVKKVTGSLHLISPFTGYRLDLDKDKYLTGECAAVSLTLNGIFDVSRLRLRLSVYNPNGEFSADTGYVEMYKLGLTERSSESMQIGLSLGPLALKKGIYFISFSILGPNGEIYIWDNRGTQIMIDSSGLGVIPDCQLQIRKADPKTSLGLPVQTL